MKNKIIWITAAVIIAAVITLFFVRSCKKGKGPVIIAAVDSVQYRWTKDSMQMISFIKQREEDYNKISKAFRDSIKKLNETNFDLVQQALLLSLKGKVTIPAAAKPEIKYKTDTVPGECPVIAAITQPYSNKWYTAIDNIDLLNPDSSFLYLQTTDSIQIVEKIVKEGGLFNRQKYLQLEVLNKNPFNTIEGITSYRKPLPKQKKIGIGFQTGVTIGSNLKPKPYAGIGISYNFIRL